MVLLVQEIFSAGITIILGIVRLVRVFREGIITVLGIIGGLGREVTDTLESWPGILVCS